MTSLSTRVAVQWSKFHLERKHCLAVYFRAFTLGPLGHWVLLV